MAELNELLQRWPHMPDDAVSPTKLTCAVTGLSQKSVRYDPRLPRIYLSKNRYGQRVRDVRRVLSGEFAS